MDIIMVSVMDNDKNHYVDTVYWDRVYGSFFVILGFSGCLDYLRSKGIVYGDFVFDFYFRVRSNYIDGICVGKDLCIRFDLLFNLLSEDLVNIC